MLKLVCAFADVMFEAASALEEIIQLTSINIEQAEVSLHSSSDLVCVCALVPQDRMHTLNYSRALLKFSCCNRNPLDNVTHCTTCEILCV